jgi:hypothetical protein
MAPIDGMGPAHQQDPSIVSIGQESLTDVFYLNVTSQGAVTSMGIDPGKCRRDSGAGTDRDGELPPESEPEAEELLSS